MFHRNACHRRVIRRKSLGLPVRSSARRLLRQLDMERLEPRVVLAADPIIAEFQALNTSTIQDADGDYSDWIEIRNRDVVPISLDGWYLTDDRTDLRKWKLPAVSIEGGQQQLVFASGKDRIDPRNELHTNFRLSGGGEYLALVKPDGITVAQDFGTEFPPQFQDQSYGLSVARDTAVLVSQSAPVRAFVPTNDSLGRSWSEVGYNDSRWLSGTMGVAFEILRPGVTVREEFDGPLGPAWTVDLPAGGSSQVNVTGGALKINVPTGQDTSFEDRGLAPLVYRDIPGDSPLDWELVTHVRKESAVRGAAGIVVYDAAAKKPAILFDYVRRTDFRLLAGGQEYATARSASQDSFFLRLVRDGLAATWSAYFKLKEADEWTLLATIQDNVNGVPVIAEPKPGLVAYTPSSTMNVEFLFAEFIVPNERPIYGTQSGLDVGAQMSGTNSSIYLRMPFTIAGDPARFDELALAAAFDDGFRAYLNGVEITSQNVPASATWNSSASAAHGAVKGRIPVQQIDVSNSIRLLRQGQNVLAVHGMNVSPGDRDFFLGVDFLATELKELSEKFFVQPSPGMPNLLPSAPAPAIVGQPGVFFGATSVELALPEPSPTLQIRYTLDGTEPTRHSALYTGPLTLSSSAMLQARTFDALPQPNFEPSHVSSGTFIALAQELRERTSDIPIMILDTLGQGLPASDTTSLVPMNVVLFDVSKATGNASLAGGLVDYVGRGGARDRGASTAAQPKPNMAFETWGTQGTTQDDDTAASLLGLAADADWVLHAPFNFDRALVRNQLAFELSNQMGMWAPEFRHMEVFLNRQDGVVTQDDYAGVYALMEKIEQGPDRIDISEITPADNQEPAITGGYIWKIDRNDPDATTFTAGRQAMNWVYPKSPRSTSALPNQMATDEQQDWVIKHFDAFAETLAEPDINDPEGYSKYIDVISWVDHHMLNVFIMNVDALRLSAYFYKDRGGKIVYGPVWDFDRSAESQDERDDDPYVWRSRLGDLGTDFFGNGTQRWWGDLFRDPGFWQLYVDRWQMWRQSVLRDENVSKVIDRLANEVRQSADRNFEKWAGVRPRTNSGYVDNLLDGTFQGEVDNMRQWLVERGAFMDSNFAGLPRFSVNGQLLPNVKGTDVPAGQPVEVAGPLREFFIDATLISGQVGVTTAKYFVPANDDLGQTWAAPNFNDAAWQSGPTGIGFDNRTSFLELIGTTVDPTAVQAGATTILTRIEFNVPDLAAARQRDLVLRMKYDDGFVAYLNGTEVTRQNLRDNDLAWNSRANSRMTPDVLEFQDLDISDFKDLLVQGRNVLAVRGINASGTGGDILVLPELVSREVRFGETVASRVYFTTDGSDPRGADGNPGPTAQLVTPATTLRIDRNTRVIARNLDPTDRGPQSSIVLTNWSRPVQYDFVVSSPELAISEVHYNPAPPTPSERAVMPGVTNEDFEFVEIYNRGTTTASLVGVELTDGVTFDFTTSAITTLQPGAYALVVHNQDAFQLRYGRQLPIAGQYTGNLSNNGEDIDLVDGTGRIAFTVNYGDNDPWPMRADGFGASLELINPAGSAAAAQSKYYSWRGSTQVGGSPGAAAPAPPGVVLNEVLSHTELPVTRSDSIELFNTGGVPVDISGWYLSDSSENFLKFRIPTGTILDVGQTIVLDESHFNPNQGANRFALNGDQGDDAWLTISDGAGGIRAIVDDVHFRATGNGESLARIPNGSGRLAPALQNTFGSPNGAPRVGSVIISELNYNPGPPSAAALAIDPTLTDSDLEFVEVHNATTSTVDLTNWQVRGGADFDFDSGTLLGPGQSIVIVTFNPEDPENVKHLNAFKAHYSIGDAVRIVGAYAGQLNNADDVVVLLRPETPPADQPHLIPRVQEDEVLYDDLAPWPAGADGTGLSLQRRGPDRFGNDGNSWMAATASPGSPAGGLAGDFNGSGVVDATDINLLFIQMRAAMPDVALDLTNDGRVNTADRDELVQRILGTNYGDANLDRVFNALDLVAVLQAGEYGDGRSGNSTWQEGDWNGDGEFDRLDLVLALQAGWYRPV